MLEAFIYTFIEAYKSMTDFEMRWSYEFPAAISNQKKDTFLTVLRAIGSPPFSSLVAREITITSVD